MCGLSNTNSSLFIEITIIILNLTYLVLLLGKVSPKCFHSFRSLAINIVEFTPFLRGQAKKPRLCYIFNYHGNHGYLRSYNRLIETVRCYDPRIIHIVSLDSASLKFTYKQAGNSILFLPICTI